tara:strand:- start:332 stop:715 length:384 start_codon:yes stop_codon:yes gene_type:complete
MNVPNDLARVAALNYHALSGGVLVEVVSNERTPAIYKIDKFLGINICSSLGVWRTWAFLSFFGDAFDVISHLLTPSSVSSTASPLQQVWHYQGNVSGGCLLYGGDSGLDSGVHGSGGRRDGAEKFQL